jgi:hypothetical protein
LGERVPFRIADEISVWGERGEGREKEWAREETDWLRERSSPLWRDIFHPIVPEAFCLLRWPLRRDWGTERERTERRKREESVTWEIYILSHLEHSPQRIEPCRRRWWRILKPSERRRNKIQKLTDSAVALGSHEGVAIADQFKHHQASLSTMSIHGLIDLIPGSRMM